ncbi:hypothetical protein [Chryseobacterium sp. HSC-36S06]|uniref:hypothetical protein n=1 Tax=Chryseobacterium sp. HSC-36S06 TaxID=2910970 RepID=UPI0020A1F799|nr:hypothetical protein [Chryseobacterium sp. HSC-36S06]MCP2039223.1 hypothetical protein [Chryseobacterium sp. HSC-36S06]
MKRINQIVLTILMVSLLTSCDFIKNSFTYKDKTKDFVETLIKEDYTKCVDQMAMTHEMAENTNIDTMKIGLANFRQLIVNSWGTELEYSFMKSEKKFSTVEADNTPPNTTLALIEFNNKKEFGVLEVLFDDKSQKILNIKTLDVKAPIPTMTYFWLFGLLAICIPIFNIYVIRQIKRSDLKKKWLKYIAVIFLNTPAITYAAVSGLSFKLINLQILLGVSFGYMGFLNSYWTFGIPLGGLYWFWKLRQQKNEVTETELTTDQNINTEPIIDNDKPTTE